VEWRAGGTTALYFFAFAAICSRWQTAPEGDQPVRRDTSVGRALTWIVLVY
jgi:hypothetical protein